MTQHNEKNWFARVLLMVVFLSGPSLALSQDDVQAPSLPPDADVRAVVDISGSMKDTDPNNLRQPAIRMLARMLPDDSRGGVWTFGQYVNMLVPSGNVTPEWREMAIERASQINSVALRTNIGEALEVASDDFYGDRRFENTHFILLTDGKVDIADDPEANNRERERILTDVVERIRERGADIHTIALSENSDQALMEKLAVRTGGGFTVAEDAEALNRLFAETLNTAAPQTEVPIEGNEFQVDEGVSEFTALIFHDTTGGLRMRRPDGLMLDQAVSSDSVEWAVEGPYDLITVQDPMPGDWQVEGDLSSNSRVTVVSDLRMAVSSLPSFFYQGQDVSVETAFYEEGRPITDPEFLNVIDLSMRLSTEGGRSGEKSLSGETPPADGVYSDTLSTLSQPGTYTITLLADGKTFSRKAERRMTLRPPVSIEMVGKGAGEESRYRLSIAPEHPDLLPGQTNVQVAVKAPGQAEPDVRPVSFDDSTGRWSTAIEPREGEGDYQVAVRVRGDMANGTPIDYTPSPLTAGFPRSSDDGMAYATPEPAPGKEEEALPGDLSDKVIEEPITSEPEPEPEPATEPPTESTEPEGSEPAAEPVDEAPEEPEPSAAPVNESEATAEKALVPFWVWVALGVTGAVVAVGIAIVMARRREQSSAGTPESDDSEPPVVHDTPEPEAGQEEPPKEEVADTTPEPEGEIPEEAEPEPDAVTSKEQPAEETDNAAEAPEEGAGEEPPEEAAPEEPPTVSQVEEPGEFDDTSETTETDEAEANDNAPESAEPEPPVASETVEEGEEPDEPAPASETGAPQTDGGAVAGDVDELDRMLRDNQEDDTLEAGLDTDEEENTEEFGLEDFDLSDIDDLPDLDDEESSDEGASKRPDDGKESDNGEEETPSRNN